MAAYPGINGAPVFSPDGTQLAMSLSRDGNSEIYIKDLETDVLRRITRRPSAIDTEPGWGPDGKSLIFTSDRAGQPQIYRIDLATSLPDRLTFQGRLQRPCAALAGWASPGLRASQRTASITSPGRIWNAMSCAS